MHDTFKYANPILCMKRGTMLLKNRSALELIFTGILILALIFAGISTQSPTGQAVKEQLSEEKTYAHTLNHRITNFFDVDALVFPSGTCTAVTEELYNNLAYRTTEITSGYKTTGRQKLATINFIFHIMARKYPNPKKYAGRVSSIHKGVYALGKCVQRIKESQGSMPTNCKGITP